MSLYICAIDDSSYFIPGVPKKVVLTILDTDPSFTTHGTGSWYYSVYFSLYPASSGGYSLGTIGSYNTSVTSATKPTSFSGNITVYITIPSGRPPGIFYIGADSSKESSLRVAINVITNAITVDFNINTGSGTKPASITKSTGSNFLLPLENNFFKIGYSAVYWNTNSYGTGTNFNLGGTYFFNNSLTLYAIWQINQYSISFNSNGGSAVTTITQNYNTPVPALPNPTKLGHTFRGWYLDEGLTRPYSITTMPAENITLYAKWDVNKYTLMFVENGGSDVINIIQEFNTAIAKPKDPTREGYTFQGWYIESNFTTLQTWPFNMPIGGKTLYAKWTINKYNVSYINKGTVLYTCSIEYSANVPDATPSYIKYTSPTLRYKFLGWSRNESATKPDTNLGVMPASDIGVYAIYETHLSALKIRGYDVNLKYGEVQIKAVYKGETKIWEDYHEE